MYQSLTHLLPQYEAFVFEEEASVDESRTQTGAVCQGVYGLPKWHGGNEPACQCRRQKRHGFHPWVGKIPWRRAWQPTAVFLPGESHGQRSLAGCSPWGRKESGLKRLGRVGGDSPEAAFCRPWTHLQGDKYQSRSRCKSSELALRSAPWEWMGHPARVQPSILSA